MSDGAERIRDPAIALLEFNSIAVGIVAGDAMVKASPLGSIYVGTVHPGKYLVLVSGDTASVEVALQVGADHGDGALIGTMFLPDVHPEVTDAMVAHRGAGSSAGDALGIVETATVAAVIGAADAGVKAANVRLGGIRMADGLGGKGYCLFTGVVAEVEAAVESAVARIDPPDQLLHHRVVALLHDAMRVNIESDLTFLERVGRRAVDRGA